MHIQQFSKIDDVAKMVRNKKEYSRNRKEKMRSKQNIIKRLNKYMPKEQCPES